MNAARMRDSLLGLLAITLLAGGLTVAYLSYSRALVPAEKVILRTDVVGNALQVGSDVKYRGVPIGRVARIEATDAGADLRLDLDPEAMEQVPGNVAARLLPKTMFGERYVALVVPAPTSGLSAVGTGGSGATLKAGAVIRQDASAEAAELQQVFDEMLPMLRAIQPDKLAAMLAEFSTMLNGNGKSLGDSLVAWSEYVQKMNPKVPAMADDFAKLARVADSWNIAAPDLVEAMATMTTSSKLLVDEQDNLRDVYASVIGSADSAGGWVKANHDTIDILTDRSRDALRASSPYASQFPCLFRAVAAMKPRMDKALGAGTGEPGMHAVLTVVPGRTKYLAGKDDIRYAQGTPGPRCPYVTGQVGSSPAKNTRASGGAWPSTGAAPTDGVQTEDTDTGQTPPTIGPPPGAPAASYLTALTGLGDANSPGENQLISELVAPTQSLAPSDYPAWSSLLLGPTLRNTKVVLK